MPTKKPRPGNPNQMAELIVEQANRGAKDRSLADDALSVQVARLLGRRRETAQAAPANAKQRDRVGKATPTKRRATKARKAR